VGKYLAPANNGGKRRKIALLLMLSGIGLITSAIVVGWLRINLQKSDPAWLPDTLAGLLLEQLAQGEEAVSEINKLHGKSFALVDGAVGSYGGGQVTLWVSQAQTTSSAEEILFAMRDRIAKGDSPFTPLRESTRGQRTVYEAEGMGQIHYYFQSSDLVIWLAVENTIAETALTDALDHFP